MCNVYVCVCEREREREREREGGRFPFPTLSLSPWNLPHKAELLNSVGYNERNKVRERESKRDTNIKMCGGRINRWVKREGYSLSEIERGIKRESESV